MGKLVCLFLVGLALTLTTAIDSIDPEPPKPTTTTSKPTTAPPTVPTTSPTVPTKVPTTPSTIPPTTPPTTPPTVPTTVPTTSPTTAPTPSTVPTKPTVPTTPPTVPTTPPPPTTPAPPPPKPVDPETFTWRVNMTNPSNVSCIVARLALQLEVPYETKDNKTQKAYLNVPKTAVVSGGCAETVQSVKLSWEKNWVEFGFRKEKEDYGVAMMEAFVVADAKTFPNIKDENKTILGTYNTALFNVSHTKSFKCDKVEILKMNGTNTNATVVQAHLSHLQMQAFLTNTTQTFSDAVDCEPFSTPDIVPIAAGCTLAALIIVVLVGYLLGRRRSQARGYLSMFTQTKREEDYIPMKNLSCFN